MEDELDQPSRPRWVPVTALAAGTVLIAAPLIYLWRIGKPQRIGLHSSAAPPRRVGALPSGGAAASTVASRFTFPAPEFPLPKEPLPPNPPPAPAGSNWDDDDWGVPPAPPDPNDDFNAAWYTFKAFGSATLVVSSLAFAGIWGLRRYFDVDNMEDFGVQMRLSIMDNMPLLALRMRRALGSPQDSVAEVTVEEKPPGEVEWSWDDAQERLSAAFDKGGLGGWADAAAREVQAEAKIEMEKREQLKAIG
ncbi:hypothetical protein C8F04DRAFT_410477 [Mycena alexandri]|uniref:Uncharacterized protein n=1 Tax=Mycena alexandri TaxID=1745969 RepID=A0AAD6X5I9_9AGAR|nr:hypothetical protein C8F04DRAFT_410477 [Mycena alexandri]